MSNDTGAVARQHHYTSLQNADREVLRGTWSIGYGDPGFTTQFGTPPEPSVCHTATSIYKIVTDARWLHRGACLACSWEGPDQRRRDAAIEDAHDHTHPGWRNLPIFDRVRSGKGSKIWWAHVRATYPKDWFDVGGPLRLYAEPPFDRHKAGAAPGGGFILYTAHRKPAPSSALQLALNKGEQPDRLSGQRLACGNGHRGSAPGLGAEPLRVGKEIRCGRVRVPSMSWYDTPVRPVALSNQGGVGTQSGHKDRKRPTKTKWCRHDSPRLTCVNVENRLA